MAEIKLYYWDEQFIDELEQGATGEKGVLVLDDIKKTATLYFVPTTTNIQRKPAERMAQSICKIGYVLKSGVRVGVGFKLDIR